MLPESVKDLELEWLLALLPSNMLEFFRDRYTQTSARAATLRQKLKLKFLPHPVTAY